MESSRATLARPARADDYAMFVRLFAELGLTDSAPSELEWQAAQRARTIVVDGPEGVLGYVYFEVVGRAAHIHHLVVAAEARRRGIGRQLLDALAVDLRRAGVHEWSLEVAPDNRAAIGLYRSAGFRPEGTTTVLKMRWDVAGPALRPSVRACVLSPERDALFEQAFELAPGTLARARERTRLGLVELTEAGAPAGVTGFVEDAAAAHPFRVRRPELALPLLAGLRDKSEPKHDEVLLIVENDPELVAELLRAGAHVEDERVLLRGRL